MLTRVDGDNKYKWWLVEMHFCIFQRAAKNVTSKKSPCVCPFFGAADIWRWKRLFRAVIIWVKTLTSLKSDCMKKTKKREMILLFRAKNGSCCCFYSGLRETSNSEGKEKEDVCCWESLEIQAQALWDMLCDHSFAWNYSNKVKVSMSVSKREKWKSCSLCSNIFVIDRSFPSSGWYC